MYYRAMEWYRQSAALGKATACNQIGEMYQHGYGVEVDIRSALKY